MLYINIYLYVFKHYIIYIYIYIYIYFKIFIIVKLHNIHNHNYNVYNMGGDGNRLFPPYFRSQSILLINVLISLLFLIQMIYVD